MRSSIRRMGARNSLHSGYGRRRGIACGKRCRRIVLRVFARSRSSESVGARSGTAFSASMDSGTGLYDLRTKKWHEDLRQACEIGIEKLAVITETSRRAITFRGLREA